MKRNHLTVARLRDLRLHAVRLSGHLHVTGLSIHGCLVVPTRAFWTALSGIAGISEPEFGDEYSFFHRCVERVGSRRLDFTVTVHVDKAQLLTDVHDPADGTLGFAADFEQPQAVDPSADRCLPWEESLEAILEDRLRRVLPEEIVTPEDEEIFTPDDDLNDSQDFPLLQGYDPQADSRRVWGWELASLPRGRFNQLLNGPDGTLRPSRN